MGNHDFRDLKPRHIAKFGNKIWDKIYAEPETIKNFRDWNRTINDCNSTAAVMKSCYSLEHFFFLVSGSGRQASFLHAFVCRLAGPLETSRSVARKLVRPYPYLLLIFPWANCKRIIFSHGSVRVISIIEQTRF